MDVNLTASHPDLEHLPWRIGFAQLGPAFYTRLAPQPLPRSYWVGRSPALAQELGLDPRWWDSPTALEAFTGNRLLPGSTPLATVYSGHQFGHWAGQLGDGRAILLGEIASASGPQEIQLKGAGRTPYSRSGDGRAVLRSSIREFLASEALHGLGIPTTRALCITGSPAPVQRETLETAAVVTRVAPSFIRFGHFEHFSANGQHAELRQLADYVIVRHYPACQGSAQPYAALLAAVTERTAHLLAAWQAVGFCHGVMNTDNMSVLGLTLDYGPFQFLDAYDPVHICNHSDTQGRYAYQQQPQIAHWNLFCLGQALMPLLDNTEQALAALAPYPEIFQQALTTRMRSKLGLPQAQAGDTELIQSTLNMLAAQRVDYTLFWHRLGHYLQQAQPQSQPNPQSPALQALQKLFQDPAPLQGWLLHYSERTMHINKELQADLMQKINPKFVLRNHLCEQAIRQATTTPQDAPAHLQQLLTVLQAPFDEHPNHQDWAELPPAWAASIQISCSS